MVDDLQQLPFAVGLGCGSRAVERILPNIVLTQTNEMHC
jgi:hypothetical protein